MKLKKTRVFFTGVYVADYFLVGRSDFPEFCRYHEVDEIQCVAST